MSCVFRNNSENRQGSGLPFGRRFGDVSFLAFLALMAAFAVGLHQHGRLDSSEISVLTGLGMFGILGRRQGNRNETSSGDAPARGRFRWFGRSVGK